MMSRHKTIKFFWFLIALIFVIGGSTRFLSQSVKTAKNQTVAKSAGGTLIDPPQKIAPFTATVASVIDGDTVILKGGEKVRYISIDTPEKSEPFFETATAANRGLVLGKSVHVTPCKLRPRDKYGRILAQVSTDQGDVAEAMLLAGMARVFEDLTCFSADQVGRQLGMMYKGYKAQKGMWANAPQAPILHDRVYDHLGEPRLVTGTITGVNKCFGSSLCAHFDDQWRTRGLTLLFGESIVQSKSLEPSRLVGKTFTVFGQLRKGLKYGPYMKVYSTKQVIEGSFE